MCQRARVSIFPCGYLSIWSHRHIVRHTGAYAIFSEGDTYHQGYFPQSLSHRTDTVLVCICQFPPCIPPGCRWFLISTQSPVTVPSRAHHSPFVLPICSSVNVVCTDTSHFPASTHLPARRIHASLVTASKYYTNHETGRPHAHLCIASHL